MKENLLRSFSDARGYLMRYDAERAAIEIEFIYENSHYKFWLKHENVSKVYYHDVQYDTFFIKIRRRYETFKKVKRDNGIVWNYSINPLLSNRDDSVVMSYVIPHNQVLKIYAYDNKTNFRWLMNQIQADNRSISCRFMIGHELNRNYLYIRMV